MFEFFCQYGDAIGVMIFLIGLHLINEATPLGGFIASLCGTITFMTNIILGCIE